MLLRKLHKKTISLLILAFSHFGVSWFPLDRLKHASNMLRIIKTSFDAYISMRLAVSFQNLVKQLCKISEINSYCNSLLFVFIGTKEHELMTYVLLFPMKVHANNSGHLRFNMAEFISESQTSNTIEQHLRHVVNMIEMVVPRGFQLVHEIVVDWSWAEINAVIRAFNGQTLKEYLSLTFEIMTTEDTSRLNNLVVLLECSSHLTKTMKSVVKKYFSEFETRMVVYEVLGSMFDCKSWAEVLQLGKCFFRIFKYPYYDEQVAADLKTVESFKVDLVFELVENPVEPVSDDFEKEEFKEIYKDSPFYQVTFIHFYET